MRIRSIASLLATVPSLLGLLFGSGISGLALLPATVSIDAFMIVLTATAAIDADAQNIPPFDCNVNNSGYPDEVLVNLTSPTNNQTFENPAGITFSAEATSPCDFPVEGVVFLLAPVIDPDTVHVIDYATRPPYSVNWKNPPPGNFYVYAVADDNHSNTGASLIANIIVNRTFSVVLTRPTNGASFALPASIDLAATANEPGGTIASVNFYHDSTLIGTATSPPYGITWVNPSAGPHQLTAQAVDALGNTATSTPVNIVATLPDLSTQDPNSYSNSPKDAGQPPLGSCQGDPINAGTGNSFQTEIDYLGAGPFPLQLVRIYNSVITNSSFLGVGWRFTYDNYRVLLLTPTSATVTRPYGDQYAFALTGGVWVSDADISGKLTQLTNGSGATTGWTYTAPDGSLERYDASGLLSAITNRLGLTQSITRTTSSKTITDPFGRTLTIGFDPSGHLTATLPDGNAYLYQVDTNNNLVAVVDPRGSQKSYSYTNSSFPHLLTSSVTGDGFASSWSYDTAGRAISNEHSGIDAVALTYSAGSTTIVDGLGTTRTQSFTTVQGVTKTTGMSQPPGSGCLAAANAIAYDTNGNVASRTDFNGNLTTYAYDLTRNLETQRVEASGSTLARTIRTQWHSYWRLPVKVSEPMKLTTYVYNGDGGVYCAPTTALVGTQPIGVLCQKTEQATTDPNGSQGFNAAATGAPRTWRYTYDGSGQVFTATGPRPDVVQRTTYTYYAATSSAYRQGDLATVTDALGHTVQITTYDPNGRPLTVIDPNGVELTFEYDPHGWVTVRTISNQTTYYSYYENGLLDGIERPDGSSVYYYYDAAGRLTDSYDTNSNAISITRDNIGNVTSTTWVNPDDSIAKYQSATYDALGRLYQIIDMRNNVSNTTTFGYDPSGNRRTVTDPKSNVTTTTYDALNRSTQITDALSGLTKFSYDARDQLTQFKAPNNAQTNLTVDGLGNVTQEVSADRGTLTATYDAAGNLLTLSDARGITETHTWDALNRPLTETYPSTGENQTYVWDSGTGCTNGVGRLCQVTDNGGVTRFAYDARGNLLSESRTEAGATSTTQLSYDTADRLVTVIAPSGKVLTTQRDTDGRIEQVATSVTSQNVNLVANVQTNAAGQTTQQTFGNGVTETRRYHTDGTPVSQTATGGGGSGGGTGDGDVPLPAWALGLLGAGLFAAVRRRVPFAQSPSKGGFLLTLLSLGIVLSSAVPPAFADETLSYDANGNVQSRTLPGGTTTYSYDALDRVDVETGPAGNRNYDFDANDNRLSDGAGNTAAYTPNTDRVATLNGVTVTKDAAGNITSAHGLTYVWNQRAGQIKTVSQGSTLLATYYYDYRGRRSRKVTTAGAPQGAATILYHYDPQDHLLGESRVNGASSSPLLTYVWRDDTLVSIILHTPAEQALYVETDHLGSPIAARDQSGKVVWKWESDAFGTTLPNEDPDGDGTKTTINLRFPGMYYDRESGLFYNWHRYYDPKLGRYLSPDLIGLAGGRNPFGYVGGNPLRYVDPTGLMGFGGGGSAAHPGQSTYVPLQVLPSSWSKPTTPTQYCVTAECAAGLLPTTQENRTQPEIEQSTCETMCGLAWPGPTVPTCAKEAAQWAASQVTGYAGCKLICSDPARRSMIVNGR